MPANFGYSLLGQNGRLGNQMFQYAALYALCKDRKAVGILPDVDIELYRAFPGLSLRKYSYEEMSGGLLSWVYSPKEDADFAYDKNMKALLPGADLRGFFQSCLYFVNHKDDILKEFQFSDAVKSECSDEYSRIMSHCNSEVCTIHFRRGDYLGKPDFHHNLSWEEYYLPAVSSMTVRHPGIKFVVFSDDYQWCKNNLPANFIFHNLTDQYHDMCLMSMFDNHIIANSSFSWWGAFLSDSAWSDSVIAPTRWFGHQGPKAWNTLYCPGWRMMGPDYANPMRRLLEYSHDSIPAQVLFPLKF